MARRTKAARARRRGTSENSFEAIGGSMTPAPETPQPEQAQRFEWKVYNDNGQTFHRMEWGGYEVEIAKVYWMDVWVVQFTNHPPGRIVATSTACYFED